MCPYTVVSGTNVISVRHTIVHQAAFQQHTHTHTHGIHSRASCWTMLCINHWKNCIVWFQVNSSENWLRTVDDVDSFTYWIKAKRKTKIKHREGSNQMRCNVGRTKTERMRGTIDDTSETNELMNETKWSRIYSCNLLSIASAVPEIWYNIAFAYTWQPKILFCHRAFSYRMLHGKAFVADHNVCATHEYTLRPRSHTIKWFLFKNE